MHDQHAGEPLGQFAAALLVEVEEDRAVLKGIIDGIGDGPSTLKEAAAWMAEKVSRLKLRREAGGELGTFEALEALALGILGKLKLWRAIPVIAEVDSRVRDVDFKHLADRAEAQHAKLEEHRLSAARTAFAAVMD